MLDRWNGWWWLRLAARTAPAGLRAWAGRGALVGACVMATACGNGSRDGVADASETATDGHDGDDSEPDPSGGGATEGGNGGDESGGGPGAADECDFKCGGHGVCAEDEAVGPTCVCDPGFASVGLDCVPCEKTGDTVAVEIPAIVFEAEVRIAGAAAPSSIYETGRVLLRNRASSDEVFLGHSHAQVVSATLVKGRYELVWAFVSGGALVPANREAHLGVIEVDNLERVVIDIPVTSLSGSIRLNGATPPDSPYENGVLLLRDRASGDEVRLGETRDAAYLVNLVPGAYDVHYQRLAGGSVVPTNDDVRLTSIVVPEPSEVATVIDFDVQSVRIDGAFSFAGVPAPASPHENGLITLVDNVTAAVVELGETRSQSFERQVVPGSYTLYYDHLAGGAIAPINRHVAIRSLDVKAAGAIDSDVPATAIGGTIRIDGQVPPANPSDDGIVELRDPETGDLARLGNTHDGTFAGIVVVPGDYELFYAQETGGAIVPANTGAWLATVNIVGTDPNLAIDIPTAAVHGTISLGGVAPPTSEYDDARIYLRNRHSGDSVLLGNTRLANFNVRAVPGVYDLVYVVETAGGQVPVNTHAVLESDITIQDGSELAVDVPVQRVSGQVSIVGKTPPIAELERGSVYLEDRSSGDAVFLARTDAPSFAKTVTSGSYLLRYRAQTTFGGAPSNTNVAFACIDVGAP